ncbi:MAG: DUF3343 domain-containing protein [Clostridia bacterium]
MIASFHSRGVTLTTYNELVHNGITCALVSTPTQANIGCGLSIRFSETDYYSVKSILSRGQTFAGFFLVTVMNGRSIVTRL